MDLLDCLRRFQVYVVPEPIDGPLYLIEAVSEILDHPVQLFECQSDSSECVLKIRVHASTLCAPCDSERGWLAA